VYRSVSDIADMTAFHIPSEDVVARRLDDVVILINLKTNRIFELNSTGARIWELISSGNSLADIREMMLREFDVSETELSSAIDTLISWLRNEGLLAGHADH
jgi:hypothetical protein